MLIGFLSLMWQVTPIPRHDFADSDTTITVSANPEFAVSSLKGWLRGEGNRTIWTTEVTVPMRDGSFQNRSVLPFDGVYRGTRQVVKLADGSEWYARSIMEIGAEKGLETSAMHPFSGPVVARLARMAGLSASRTQLVWLRTDSIEEAAPEIGKTRHAHSGSLMLLEALDEVNSGLVSSGVLRKALVASPLNKVDEEAYIRQRLFDWLVGDWDQPETQWAWRMQERDGFVLALPVALDRSAAFSRYDGAIFDVERLTGPSGRRFQTFDEDPGYFPGFLRTGLSADRRFTSESDANVWLQAAEDLARTLTDERIREAVEALPPPLNQVHGPILVEVIRKRRNQLSDAAATMFRLTSQCVDIVGTDTADYFEVVRLDSGSTQVNVYSGSNSGTPHYSRLFRRNGTTELRLFGLAGNDQFFLAGASDEGPTVIIAGGEGEDSYTDLSRIPSLVPQVYVYDTKSDSEWSGGGRMRFKPTERPVDYTPDMYQRSYSLPLAYFGYNNDDGAFLGGGVHFLRHAFRKEPYVASHKVVANIALRTYGFNLRYAGRFPERVGVWDLLVEGNYLSPKNVQNYFRLGNETDDSQETADYYSAQLSRVRTSLLAWLERDHLDIRIGPFAEHFTVLEDSDTENGPAQPGIVAEPYRNRWYAGLRSEWTIRSLDDRYNPMMGIQWQTELVAHQGLTIPSEKYLSMGSWIGAYYSPIRSPQVTIALRVGADHIVGDFPYYGAVYLGEYRNLRGYRRRRFRGRSVAYHNIEIRNEIPSRSLARHVRKMGTLAFWDRGRAWTDGESSSVWHNGLGFGGWAQVSGNTVFMVALGFSAENQGWVTVKTSFQF